MNLNFTYESGDTKNNYYKVPVQPLFYSLNLLFSAITVAVVAFLNFLKSPNKGFNEVNSGSAQVFILVLTFDQASLLFFCGKKRRNA